MIVQVLSACSQWNIFLFKFWQCGSSLVCRKSDQQCTLKMIIKEERLSSQSLIFLILYSYLHPPPPSLVLQLKPDLSTNIFFIRLTLLCSSKVQLRRKSPLHNTACVNKFEFLCPFSINVLLLISWTENKKFVDSLQQCFAFTHQAKIQILTAICSIVKLKPT